MGKIENAMKYDNLLKQMKFESDEYADRFRSIVEAELHIRIGSHITKAVGPKGLKEFDACETSKEAAMWLKRNCPNYEDIVINQKEAMYNEILKYRDSIPFLIKESIEND